MTLEKAKKQFKKHHKMAMRLKEGGKAWEREITLADRFLRIGKAIYQQKITAKYSR